MKALFVRAEWEWALQHRKELMEDWILCEQLQTPKKIRPLE